MLKWIAALAICMFPVCTSAQTQSVQSGWHETFTRLVVPVSGPDDWAVFRTENGYVVETSLAESLDLSGAFELIPAERVSSLAVSQIGLEISVSCACFVDAFLFRPGLLVVDIIEGEPSESSPFEYSLNDPEPSPTVVLDFNETSVPAPNNLLEAISPLEELNSEGASAVDSFAENVSENLMRGIEQGLLNANPDQFDSNETKERNLTGQIEDPSEQRTTGDGPSLGIQASTSVDIGIDLGSLQSNGESRTNCWPDSYVSVVDWAPGEGFNEDMASLRLGLFEDLERPRPSAYRDLARAYIFYSFGAEALKTTAASSENSSELIAVRELAQIIDDDDYESEMLVSQLECAGEVAVWALLSSDTTSIAPDVSVDEIIANFRMLPDVLRAHLTPKMAERLTDVGELDAAKFLLEGRPESPDLVGDIALITSLIAEEDGELSEAEAVLEEAQSQLPVVDPEVFARLVQLRVDQDAEIEGELIEDIEAALFTNRNSPEAVGLFSTLMDALVYLDDFERSFATVDQFSRSMPLEVVSSYETMALNALVERGPDLMFLELAFANRGENAPPGIQNKFASRLTELGFPDRALATVAGSAEGDVMANRRIIRAEAHLARRDFDSARQQIAGMTSLEALSVLQKIDETEDVIEDPRSAVAALQAQERVTEEFDDPLLERAARLVNENSQLVSGTDTPLRDSAELISQSEETRQTIEDLLERFQLP